MSIPQPGSHRRGRRHARAALPPRSTREASRLGSGQSTTVVLEIAGGPALPEAARALVELVRLPSGGLQDDVAIVLCRQLA